MRKQIQCGLNCAKKSQKAPAKQRKINIIKAGKRFLYIIIFLGLAVHLFFAHDPIDANNDPSNNLLSQKSTAEQ
ncbi:hypothetical protein KKF05_03020 [Patescibacteria group bacterium]|nr:hypothetical protein [Patescibacteria group bacterium]